MDTTWNRLARFDDHDGVARIMLDDELQHEINETYEWGDDYEGGFVYSGDSSMYEGLTIIDAPISRFDSLYDAVYQFDGVRDSTFYYCFGKLRNMTKQYMTTRFEYCKMG